LKTLRALERKLQTSGQLADTMKADEKRLSAELRRTRKTEKAGAAASSKTLEQESAAWSAALAEERKAIALYDFAAALDAIDAVDFADASLREAQATQRKKVQWLADWKTKLIADLSTGRFSAPVTTLRGVNYTGAAGAKEASITLRLPPYGSAEVKWTDLAPNTLLAMSTSFIAPNSADAADRQWLAAAFAQATAQGEAARALGEAAARSKPEYRDQLPLLTAAP
jgi:hypothetical protein